MYGNCFGNGFLYVLGSQILFFIITIGLAVWFIKNTRSGEDAEEILRRRLAKGEINRKEYETLLKAINRGG